MKVPPFSAQVRLSELVALAQAIAAATPKT
jgi:hypothetical protein